MTAQHRYTTEQMVRDALRGPGKSLRLNRSKRKTAHVNDQHSMPKGTWTYVTRDKIMHNDKTYTLEVLSCAPDGRGGFVIEYIVTRIK